jgi:hypothetical protein
MPAGYWPEAKVAEVLAKTQAIRLAPDLSGLDPDEKAAWSRCSRPARSCSVSTKTPAITRPWSPTMT